MHYPADAPRSESIRCGRVFKKSQGLYAVDADGQTVSCALSNKLRKQLVYPIADPSSLRRHVVAVADIGAVDPVAIGDLVRFVGPGDGSGMITEVLPRRNQLTRRAAGPKPLEQVIVANADQLLAVMAVARPAPSWELMDRYIAAGEEAGLPTRIVVTKLDLVDRDLLLAEVRTYRQVGYSVILTSAETGEGLDELKATLAGRVSVLAGKSGVGKTTLLNAIQPGLGLRVAEVGRHTNKGKHTTTQLEMFGLNVGGAVVDTPGMREFGLWDVAAADLAHLFVDLRPFVGRCRFGLDCTHTHEPACAIKRAVDAGQIASRRYQSYLRMVQTL